MEKVVTLKSVNREIKKVTRKTYQSLQTVNQNNYLTVYDQAQELFTKITDKIETNKINKSFFLDFFNYTKEIESFFSMINLNNMNDKDIDILLSKRVDYIISLTQIIQSITLADFR